MSIRNFVPEVWNANLLVALRKTLIYGSPLIVNRNYQGDIAEHGDTVRVTSVGRPTISDYVPNVTKLTPEQLNTGQRTLTIDQAKSFSFEVDDVDARQAAGTFMQEAAGEAGFGLADVMDQYIAGLYTAIPASQRLDLLTLAGGAATASTNVPKVYDELLVPLSVRLDELNVPAAGRYAVMPPWVYGVLRRDSRFIEADKSANPGALRTGQVGGAAGFTILVSNNTPEPVPGQNVVQAGNNSAITMAEQISKTEAFRPQDAFSDALKGLSLYGAKVFRPDALVMGTVGRS